MSWFSKFQRLCALAVTTIVAPDVRTSHSNSTTSASAFSSQNLKLSSVHVYFRHGARTPFTDLPGKAGHVAFWSSKEHCRSPQLAVDVRIVDGEGVLRESPPYAPERDKTARLQGGGDCWVGALTVDGQNACLALGRRLRHRYGQLLSCGYNPKDLQLRSTNLNRTIHSMRCLLYGMFEAERAKLTLEPPIVEVLLHDKDSLVPKYSSTSTLEDLLTTELVSVRRNVTSALKSEDPEMNEDFNDPVSKKFLLLHNFYDTIISFLHHGFPVSKALLQHKSQLEWASCMEILRHMLGDPRYWVDYLPHIVGRECDKLRHKLLLYATETHQPSFHLNATHDTFIMCLLEAFEVFDYTWPNYAADLVVELWKEQVTAGSPKFWVRLVYCGKVQQLPDSDNGWCSLEEFSKRLSVCALPSKDLASTF